MKCSFLVRGVICSPAQRSSIFERRLAFAIKFLYGGFIHLSPQYGPCLTSPFWRLKFSGDSKIFVTCVHPGIADT
jgi:hypothetical protein